MIQRKILLRSGSIELVVIGLLAALVVLLAFPIINGLQDTSSGAESVVDRLIVD